MNEHEQKITSIIKDLREAERGKLDDVMQKEFVRARKRKEAEKTDTERAEKISPKQRHWVKGIIERATNFLSRKHIEHSIAQKTKDTPNDAYKKLYNDLQNRGIISGEAHEYNQTQLEDQLARFYWKKACLYKEKTKESVYYSSRYDDPPQHIPHKSEMQKLDAAISDDEVRLDEAKSRERVIAAIERAESIYKNNLEADQHYYGPERHRKFEEMQQRRELYEKLRNKENQDVLKIESILEKETLTAEDIKELQTWMDSHREYGLKEMTDEEYEDLFSDGRFYFHSTNFFRINRTTPPDDPAHLQGPRFVEALKDGYLIGRIIGDQRGKPMSRDLATAERAVFFDSHLEMNLLRANSMPHLGYAPEGENRSIVYNFNRLPPVILAAPARLLEAHTIKEPYDLKKGNDFSSPTGERPDSSIAIGVGADGDAFGSGNPDARNESHEIELGLFVLLLPRVQAKQELIRDVLTSIIDDPRFQKSTIPRLARTALKLIPQEGVDLESFMRAMFSRAAKTSKGGIETPSLPRLYFYDVPLDPTKTQIGSDAAGRSIEAGFAEFLDALHIRPSIERGTESDQTPQAMLPETHRINPKKLDGIASNIRRRLRNEGCSPTTISLKESREHTRASAFTRGELQEVLEKKGDISKDLISLFEKEFGDTLNQHIYGKEDGPTLRDHISNTLHKFEKYFGNKKLPEGISHEMMRLLLSLHAIGRPKAIKEHAQDRHPVYTRYIATDLLQRLGFSEKEIRLADTLLGANPLEPYLRGYHGGNTIGVMETSARSLDFPIRDYYELLKVMYKLEAVDEPKKIFSEAFSVTDVLTFYTLAGDIDFTKKATKNLEYIERQVDFIENKDSSNRKMAALYD